MTPLTDFNYPELSLAINQSIRERKRHTLLIIDENTSARKELREALLSYYDIQEAVDISVGMELAMHGLPDLIIIELEAAEKNGDSFCLSLKQSQRTSHIPIIVLTDRDDAYSRIRSFYLGADDFIKMPFHLLELQVRIQNLIQLRKTLQEKFSRHVQLNPAPAEGQSEDERFLQRVMQIMEDNMADPAFTSEAFARELGLSQTRFYRKLMALTGNSSNDFIRRMRLQRAADLLNKRVGNVSEVAYRVGFSSMSYFAKCFKQLHHYSPRDFARKTGS